MPNRIVLTNAKINSTDALSIELAERDGTALIKITWPTHPTMSDPKDFPELAANVTRLFALAATRLAQIKRDRRI